MATNKHKKIVEKAEEEYLKLLEETKEELINISLKEHREPCLKAVGEYLFEEMMSGILSFFWQAFAKRQEKLRNTMNINQAKNGRN